MPIKRAGDVKTRRSLKVGRNDPCPCGSGKKYKACHESEGEAFLQKLVRDRTKEIREEQMKEEGVPWLKRVLTRALD